MKKNRIRLSTGSEKLESRELLSGSSSAYCCCAPTAVQSNPADNATVSTGNRFPVAINNVNSIGGGFGRFGRHSLGETFSGNGGNSQVNSSAGFAGQFNGNLSGGFQGATNIAGGPTFNGGEGGKKGRNSFFSGGNISRNRNIAGSVEGNLSGDFSGNITGNVAGNVSGNVSGGFDSTTAVESSVESCGTGVVSNSGSETVDSSNVSGITINNYNIVDRFAGFGGFAGNFQGQFSGNVSGEFDTSIGSTREFNGNTYNLIRNHGSKLTYKNTSLQGGQRTVDFNTVTGTFKTHSPIVLDLDGSGRIETTGASTAQHRVGGAVGQTVSFDINGDGTSENIEWLSGSGDGLLVDDRDGNAATNMNGNRLFGDANGQFSSGYEKLAKLDVDGDGVVSGSELGGLKVWIDNGDARVETSEMKSLADVGVDQISVQRHDVTNSAGETLMQSVAQRHGQTILTEDVWFGQA